MIYQSICAVPDAEAFLAAYELERGPGAKIQDEDRYISAGRDDNGQPTLFHVDSLHGYPVTTHGILSVGSDYQIDGLAAVRVHVSNGPALLAMEQDVNVAILGAEDEEGVGAPSQQGPIGRNDPLTDERWVVVRTTLIGFYPGIEGPLDSYRTAHPECTPLDVWGALIDWMGNQ